MLEIRNIHKRFGALDVLRGVDIAVEQGDVVAILGPSGSGKTTLLRCINFLETADSGEMIFDGERFDLRSLMVLIFNGETAGGFHLARRSSIKDGLFDCILLEKKNFFRSTLAMCRYLAGGSPKIVRHLRARRIDIRSSVNEPTDVDGQKGAEFPLHIECLAGGLRVMCAKQASGNF